MSEATRRGHIVFLIALFLFAGTFAVYFPVKNHVFIDFDDAEYIVENPHVATGLTLENVKWAFASSHSNNWHPLTWISHMIDVELFGLRPAGHHLVNVLFHALNAVLLLLALFRMTGRLWQSAFVAALFAFHPLHVESVAWAAERKDVLCTFFFMLTLLIYLSYVEEGGWKRYTAALASFSLGLMCKQMLVTLPFVLLLLDFWPLKRFRPDQAPTAAGPEKWRKGTPEKRKRPVRTAEGGRPSSDAAPAWRGLIVEKIPFLILAAAAAITVFAVQLKSGVLYNLNPFPVSVRLENGVVSYAAYLGKMLWPSHLAVFYPHPQNGLAAWQTMGAAGLLIVITLFCLKYVRSRPYLSVGWFWYVGTLVPVIGLVQVGVQAMADRYTYIPLIGIFIMLAWGLPDLLHGLRSRTHVFAVFAGAVLLICCVLTRVQLDTWKDQASLYKHAIDAIPQNYWAYNNFGASIASEGRIDEAMGYFSKSLEIMPLYPGANKNMAVAFIKKGRYGEAIPYLRKALGMRPRDPEYLVLMGLALMKTGKGPDAVAYFKEALRLNPSDPNAREGLQEALAQKNTNPSKTIPGGRRIP